MNQPSRIHKPVIGISVGDFNGIGPEIILKTLSDKKIYDFCTPLVFCCKNLISYYVKVLSISDLVFEQTQNPKHLNHKKLNLFCNWSNENDLQVEMGKPTEASGKYAFKSLQAGVFSLKQGHIQALVTAPINKSNIQSEEFSYPGHSEYIMTESGASSYLMLMVSDVMKMGVATAHMALKEVPSAISKSLILEKLDVFNNTLLTDFSITKPRIAILGLNPHAGDDGLFGNEEIEAIIPAIKEANEKGIMALGPFPADGFFGSNLHLKYDGILAMYHDQGLVPFKALAFENGVNYTAGLPFIRTSPVHGTGFNIAGQGIADESSFREALFLAIKMERNRELYREITKDPLQTKLVREKEDI